MNTNGTFSTALLRSVGLAVLGVLAVGWTVYIKTGDWQTSVAAGIAAATAAIAGRGVGEGAYDSKRQSAGNVSNSDVQPGAAGKP